MLSKDKEYVQKKLGVVIKLKLKIKILRLHLQRSNDNLIIIINKQLIFFSVNCSDK